MPQSIEGMNTQQKLQLMANLAVSVKQSVQEEYAGTDLVPAIDGLMDEIAGGLGEALKEIESAAAGEQNPMAVEPGTPAPPAEPVAAG